MRLFVSSFTFILALVLGALAFAATAIEFPGIMRELVAAAGGLPDYLSSTGLSDSYMVWIDILLTGDKLVLLGFVAAARIVLAVLGGILGPLFGMGRERARPLRIDDTAGRNSPFDRWG